MKADLLVGGLQGSVGAFNIHGHELVQPVNPIM